MKKNRIALFLSLIVISLVITPPVLASIDKDFELSISLDLNEEENKENKLFEIDDFHPQFTSHDFILQVRKVYFDYYTLAYKPFHTVQQSPPPELL